MPSIINATTTNGLVSSADNSGSLQLATNSGTTAVTIGTTQNIGIGATDNANIRLLVRQAVDSDVGGIGFQSVNGSSTAVISELNTGALVTRNGGAERMRIDSAGNVGIGTNSPLNAAGTNLHITAAGGTARIVLESTGGSGRQYRITTDQLGALNFFDNPSATIRLQIDSNGALILAGSTAQKATGTTWSNPSDQRLKDNIRDYTKGMTELMKVRVREWEYNGKGGTVEGTKGLGVVADEIMDVLPETVENYKAKLNADDEESIAIKKFDATEITWLLVKAVQEQQAMIEELKLEVQALKGIE
jgi:hypothetical protein